MPKRHRPGGSATRLLAHIEEIVLATSGEDAFEVVFALAAARLERSRKTSALSHALQHVARARPELGIALPADAPPDLLRRVDALLAPALAENHLEALDAIFEALVPRVAKGDKGQFFTPRSVVELMVRALGPGPRDVVVDPACGSGAFLAHAFAHGKSRTFGCDVDPRAVRVARLFALAQGRPLDTLVRADGLREPLPRASIVLSNPPFAGRADASGFEVAALVRSPERDVLFLERAVSLLGPGGRLGIVLPYNKAAGIAFARVRRWLAARARIMAVLALPKETFLPHTAQRTVVVFAKKRARTLAALDPDERTMLLVSERAGKATSGEPLFRADGARDDDLDEVLAALRPFLRAS